MSVRYLSLPTAAVHRSRGARRRHTHHSDPDARAGHVQSIYVGDLPRCGSLAQPLYNAHGALLLKAGETISDRFLSKLRAHGIYEIYVPQGGSPIGEQAVPAPTADLSPITRRLDRLVENEGHIEPRLLIRNAKRPRLSLEQLRAETQRAATAYTQAVSQVGELTEDLLTGRCSSAAGARQLMSRFLEWIHLDADLVPALTRLETSPDDYLYQHGLNVALMSMTVAAQLSVPQDQILHLGVGALIQDVGMLRVPRELRQAPRQLTEAERFEIARHPLHTLDCLQNVRGLSDLSLIVAYQSHERGDGSGYPRQRRRTTIHPLARLAAIADTYAAITAHRPHRTARGPYEAMEILLRETSRDRFDRRVMRSFLDCISLFPIGSQVRLSDGQFAKVLRANPGLHTKPVVVPLQDDGTESGSELDLSCAPGLTVIQALRDDHELAIAGANGTGGSGGVS